MRPHPLSAALLVIAHACVACSGTGQPEVEYPAFAVATVPESIEAGDWQVTLERAEVAFGPVYFCAAASGSATLCETAVGELASVHLVDALSGEAQPLGTVRGLAGAVRSASYDYGLHWYLTESSANADPAAPGGHSAMFMGRATNGDGDALDFRAEVDVLPQYRGQRAVPTARADATVRDDVDTRLEVRFDPAAWIAGVDFDDLFAEAVDGGVVVSAGSTAHDAIAIAMVATHPAEFSWTETAE